MNFRQEPIYDLSSRIGQEKTKDIPFLHTFTYCQSVSSFEGKRNTELGELGMFFLDVSNMFAQLSMYSLSIYTEYSDMLK